jgi:hypothetical protein
VRRFARPRPAILACIGFSALAVVGLVLAASRGFELREFALRSPDQRSVALLRPSQQVCEGPVSSPQRFDSVGIWGSSVVGTAGLSVEVQEAGTRRMLASARIGATTATGEHVGALSHPISAARPLRICLVGDLNTFSVAGSDAQYANVVMTGRRPGSEFSLVLLRHRKSLLSALPTAFSRASVFHLSWVGSWTFWVLGIGLLGTFGLIVIAVADAADSDEDDPS